MTYTNFLIGLGIFLILGFLILLFLMPEEKKRAKKKKRKHKEALVEPSTSDEQWQKNY